MDNLAEKIAKAVQHHYAWWDLPDEEDLIQDNAVLLSTLDGCRDLINQLCDLILDAE